MPSRSGVTVLGSANLDLTLRVDALPAAGQTVLAAPRVVGPGGKGLNQAVAAARAGASTRFVGAVGTDPEGAQLLRVLAADGIDSVVRRTVTPTGVAVVMVDRAGENSIIVEPGANTELVDLTLSELAAVTASRVLLMQLEVPTSAVLAAARETKGAGTVVILNASPPMAPDGPLGDVLDVIDVLVVNEGEARTLAGVRAADGSAADTDAQVGRLLDWVPAVVVTLGPGGALYQDRTGASHDAPGRSVVVTDTTGAGDTFAGYLAAGLADGLRVPLALRRANAAAALCVQRPGAVPAVPHRAEVDDATRG